MIKIDLKVGDTVLTGKWKNKKVVVKNIGTDEFGSPTVNGKSILKIRIPKFYQQESIVKKIKEDFGRTPLNVREFEQQIVKPKLKKYKSSIQFDDTDYINLSKEYENLYKNKWTHIHLPNQHSNQTAKISSDGKVIKGTAYHQGGIIGVLYIKESMVKLKDLIKEKVTIKKDNNFSNYKYKLKDNVEFIHPETKKKTIGKVVGKERIIRQGNFSDEDVDETFINIVSDGEAISVAEDKVLRRVK